MAQWLEALKRHAEQVDGTEPATSLDRQVYSAEHLAAKARVAYVPGWGYRLSVQQRNPDRFADAVCVQEALIEAGIPLTGWCSSRDALAPHRVYRRQEALAWQSYQVKRDAMLQALDQEYRTTLQTLAQQRDQHLAELVTNLN